jgi:4-hydroxy-tetrahydrodipicolinate reductase
MSTKVVIAGAKGRMGQALLTCAARHPEWEVVGAVDVGDDLERVLGEADVLIDFSLHEATLPMVELCADRGKALVIGTTGHTELEQASITELAGRIPTVWASNYSTGVNLLFWLTQQTATILGRDWDLEIVEMHHRMKQDAPSGTAQSLARILAGVRGNALENSLLHGRKGMTGARKPEQIGVHSLRGGDVVGDHTVVLASFGERLELTHRATSRETFAEGALRAASWVVSQPPGLYDMQDVLGLK